MMYLWLVSAGVWTTAVLVLGLSPDLKSSWLLKSFGDKLIHAAAFTVGGLLWAKALSSRWRSHPVLAILLGGLVAILVGLALEGLQHYVPGRKSDVHDFLADVLGVLPALAYLLAAEYLRSLRRASRA